MPATAAEALELERYADQLWSLDLASYAEYASGGAWQPYPYLEWIADEIQDAVLAGGAQIVVNLPPRHGKSELICHWLVTWFLDFFPERRVVIASYGADIAKDWGRTVRNEFFRNPATVTRPSTDSKAAFRWNTHEGGAMISYGVNGSFIGRGGDLLILDDPYKNFKEARSGVVREAVSKWFESSFSPRREPRASVIVVHQRWHEKDLSGELLAKTDEKGDPQWRGIVLPAVAELDDPLGRAPGEALCPERYDERALLRVKNGMTPEVWSAVYQQNPRPREGGILEEKWLRRFRLDDIPGRVRATAQSWDMTFKDTQDGSFVTGTAWLRVGDIAYLVDLIRARVDFVDSLKMMQELHRRRPSTITYVEEKANGAAVFSMLKSKVNGVTPVIPDRHGSKEERLQVCAPYFLAGRVFIPEDDEAPWVPGYVDELLAGGNEPAHDDQIDATTQLLLEWFGGERNWSGLIS